MSAERTTPEPNPDPSAVTRGHTFGAIVPGGLSALAAEFIGTLILIFLAVGTAIFADVRAGVTGIALAFGFVLIALVYTIGTVSGCHVNPAVTFGMVLSRRMHPLCGLLYMVMQFAGGIMGALLLYWVSNAVQARVGGPFSRNSFGSDGYGSNSDLQISVGGAFLVEVILTTVLVAVVLGVTHGPGVKGLEGVAIGTVLTGIHLVGIPLTGTSVNPARSLGPAIFASNNALSQVWLFIVAPLVGSIVAVVVHAVLRGRATVPHAADAELAAAHAASHPAKG